MLDSRILAGRQPESARPDIGAGFIIAGCGQELCSCRANKCANQERYQKRSGNWPVSRSSLDQRGTPIRGRQAGLIRGAGSCLSRVCCG